MGNGVGILYSLLHLLLLLSMFGGHVTVGNLEVDNCFQTLVRGNSWFKCNKMIVCLDFVYDLVGLFLRFVLFPWIETSEMKLAAGAQLATAAMLPSPVLLWRLKVPCLSIFSILLVCWLYYKKGYIWRCVRNWFCLSINLNLRINLWLLVECGCAFATWSFIIIYSLECMESIII